MPEFTAGSVTVRADDRTFETRWPLSARHAADLGLLSTMAFQLYVKDTEPGSLNPYSRSVDGFDNPDEETGLPFAGQAAVGMVGAGREQDLLIAINSRDPISQTKGILMARGQSIASDASTC